MTPKHPSVATVVGLNAQRLRGNHKVDEVAREARARGLKWNSARVFDLENGRISPTIPTLIILADSLTSILEQPISVADLVHVEGWITLSPELVVRGSVVSAALRGNGVKIDAGDRYLAPIEVAEAIRSSRSNPADAAAVSSMARVATEADMKAAKSLGISNIQLAKTSRSLWGKSFTEERDSRAGLEASAQKLGRVSRELKAELKEALSSGND